MLFQAPGGRPAQAGLSPSGQREESSVGDEMGQILSTRETVWEQHQLPPRRTNFGFLVRDALRHLYDLSYLQTHPLGQLLRREPGVPVSRMDRMLQQRLQEAVEWLRPHTETS